MQFRRDHPGRSRSAAVQKVLIYPKADPQGSAFLVPQKICIRVRRGRSGSSPQLQAAFSLIFTANTKHLTGRTQSLRSQKGFSLRRSCRRPQAVTDEVCGTACVHLRASADPDCGHAAPRLHHIRPFGAPSPQGEGCGTGLFDKLKRDRPEAVPFIIYVFIPQGCR